MTARDMEEIITKELAQKLMEIGGEARGEHFINDLNYILEREGEDGLKKVERELEALGTPIKYREIENTKFYPVGLRAISLLAMKKALGWNDKDIRALGKFAVAGAPLIIRLYMKFFHSPSQTAKMSPRMWREYFTTGNFEVVKYNESEKRATLRIEDFKLHPIFCRAAEGYFAGLLKMIFKEKGMVCREVECSFEGGRFHEFIAESK